MEPFTNTKICHICVTEKTKKWLKHFWEFEQNPLFTLHKEMSEKALNYK